MKKMIIIVLIISVMLGLSNIVRAYTFTVNNHLNQNLVLVYKIDDYNAYYKQVISSGGSYNVNFNSEFEYFLSLETNESDVFIVFEHNTIKSENYTRDVYFDDLLKMFDVEQTYNLTYYQFDYKHTSIFPFYVNKEIWIKEYEDSDFYFELYDNNELKKRIDYDTYATDTTYSFYNYIIFNNDKTKMLLIIDARSWGGYPELDVIHIDGPDNVYTENIYKKGLATGSDLVGNVEVYYNKTRVIIYNVEDNKTYVYDRDTFIKLNETVNFNKLTKMVPYSYFFRESYYVRYDFRTWIKTKYYTITFILNNTLFYDEPDSLIVFYNQSSNKLEYLNLNTYFIVYNETTLKIDKFIYTVETSDTSHTSNTFHYDFSTSFNLTNVVDWANLTIFLKEYGVSDNDILLMKDISNASLDKFTSDLFSTQSLLSSILATVIFTIITISAYMITQDPLLTLYEMSLMNMIFYTILNVNLVSFTTNILVSVAIIVKMLRDFMLKHQEN